MNSAQESKKRFRVRGVSSRNNYMLKRKAIYSLIQESREVRDQFGRLVIDEDRQDPQQQPPQQPQQRRPQQDHWEGQRRNGWITPHSRRVDELLDQVVLLRQELDMKQRLITGLEQQLTSEQQRSQTCQQLIGQQQQLIQQLQVQVAQLQREDSIRVSDRRRPSPENQWRRRSPERRRSRSPLNRPKEPTIRTPTFQVVRDRPQQSMKNLVEEFLSGQTVTRVEDQPRTCKTSLISKPTVTKPADPPKIETKTQGDSATTTATIVKSKSSITLVPRKDKEGAKEANKTKKAGVESKAGRVEKLKSSSMNPTVKLHRMVESLTISTPPPPAPAILEELSQPTMDPL